MASSVFAEVRGFMIRRLREDAGLTQAELAHNAGYGAGGRVALAKIEQGRAEPTAARLEGICDALNTNPAQLDQTIASVLVAKPGPRSGGWVENVILGGAGGAEAASNARRQRAIDLETEGLQRGMQARLDRGKMASVDARDRFALPCLQLAGRVNSLPIPTPQTRLAGRTVDLPVQVRASVQEMGQVTMGIQILRAAQNIGVAGKNAAYAAVGTFGTASTGVKIAELHGAAKHNAIKAQFGGGAKAAGGRGIAGGNPVLTAIGVAPLVLAAGGMLFYTVMQARSRAKDEASKLTEVEVALEATRAVLPQIWAWADEQADVLTKLAAAGAELITNLETAVGADEAVEWESLDAPVQRDLERAVELVSAVLAVDALPIWEPPAVTDAPAPGTDEITAAWISAVLQHGHDLTEMP